MLQLRCIVLRSSCCTHIIGTKSEVHAKAWGARTATSMGLTCVPELILAALARVVQVVQGEDDARSFQAIVVVLVPVQHGQG